MKIVAIAIASLIASTLFMDTAWAGSNRNSPKKTRNVSVREYTRKDGTHVKQHLRTNPNEIENDNWSTIGNTNPYTGKKGTKRKRPLKS